MRVIFAFVLGFLLMTLSCKEKEIFYDDGLSLAKMPYSGNQLKTEGYYYYPYENQFLAIYFFYRNGVLMSGGVSIPPVGSSPFEFKENQFGSQTYLDGLKQSKNFWGLFNIDGNKIKFEKWYCDHQGCKAFVRAGTILNDTTFHISESYRMHKGRITEWRSKDETYYYKAFSPKPDSTNSFTN